MSRELNGEFFGITKPVQPERSALQDQTAQLENKQRDLVVKELINEVRVLKRKLNELENSAKVTSGRLNSLAQATKTQVERLQGGCQRLDKALKTSVQEFTSKFSQLSGKLTEQRVNDNKMLMTLERHNSIVQSFETRVSQLQKVISEQELKNLNYHAALEEFRRRS